MVSIAVCSLGKKSEFASLAPPVLYRLWCTLLVTPKAPKELKNVELGETPTYNLNSLIGKTIKTWPQLGSTATIAGGLITTLVKKMVLRERVKSGRYYFSIDKLLVYDYDSKKRKKKKEQLSDEIAKKIF